MLEVFPAERATLLADGATGTGLFAMGLARDAAPEVWIEAHPERVAALHRAFLGAGSDIILTNSFGCNRRRLARHGLAPRAGDLARKAARIAREVADAAGRPVIVAGSVGPTGERPAADGGLNEEEMVAVFAEQIDGLKGGGIDLIWIETMSALEEMRAAARAAARAGMPYAVTASFHDAGRSMSGMTPQGFAEAVLSFAPAPVAIGANCGSGPADVLVAVLAITERFPDSLVIAKANCGIPGIGKDRLRYPATPEVMADYARLAVDAGARIVGGCCGAGREHVLAMRRALDAHVPGPRPTFVTIAARLGLPPVAAADARAEKTLRRRRGC